MGKFCLSLELLAAIRQRECQCGVATRNFVTASLMLGLLNHRDSIHVAIPAAVLLNQGKYDLPHALADILDRLEGAK